MDTQTSNELFDDLINRWSNAGSKYEEGLLNIDDNMRPETKIDFREIIPISAKHSNKTIQYVKNRIRTHLDDIEDERTKYSEILLSVNNELDVINADDGPRIA